MILVTGATGNVGRRAVSELLAAGVAVRALTRSPDDAGLPDAAQLVRGDLSKPETVRAALKGGVEAVLFVWPLPTAKRAAAVLEVVAGHTSRIVYLSSLSVQDGLERQLDPISACHAAIERLIERSGLRWNFLRPSGFATNTLVWAPQIRSGDTVRWPYGAARRSLIDERDIAAVAARVLLDERRAGERHVLTGPQALSQVEQLDAIGEAVGRRLRYEETPPGRARQALFRAWGVPGIAARVLPPGAFPRRMADGMIAAWAGMTKEPEPVTETVQAITGAPAHTFRAWANEHAAQFRLGG